MKIFFRIILAGISFVTFSSDVFAQLYSNPGGFQPKPYQPYMPSAAAARLQLFSNVCVRYILSKVRLKVPVDSMHIIKKCMIRFAQKPNFVIRSAMTKD